jgi:outer membrane receptor protein involved in Fe transport
MIARFIVLTLGLAGIIAAAASPLPAQAPATVSGRVLDAVSGDPVEGADLSFETARVATGRDGHFDFGAVSTGRATLRVRRIGYDPVSIVLDILPASALERDILLQPRAVALDSLVVEGREVSPGISHADLEPRGRTLALALDGWEGITMRPGPDGGTAPTLRGSAPDEVLVLLDGLPLNDPYTGRADLRRVPTATVEEVRLYPGAQGAVFGGRAIAGVVEIVSRGHAPGELALSAGSHGRVGGTAAGQIGSVAASVSREGLADGYGYSLPAVRGTGDATRLNAGGQIWSFNLRRAGETEVILRGSASERGLPGPVTNPTPTAHASDWSVLGAVRHRGHLDVGADVQLLQSRFRDSSPPLGASYDSESRGLETNLRLARQLLLNGSRLGLRLGMGAGYTAYQGDNIPAGSDQARGSLDLQAIWRAADRLALSSSGRIDWWSGLDLPVGSLRADLRYALGGVILTAAAGSSVAAPVLADLFFREGNSVRVNPNLQPERVRWEVEVGARRAGRVEGLEVELGLRGFAGRVDDMVLWGQSPGYRFAWMPQNFDVTRRGGEATMSIHPLEQFRMSASASLSRLTRPWDGAPQLPYRPVYTVATSATWDAAVWRLDARWHLVSDRNRDYSGVNQMSSYALLGIGVEVLPFSRFRLRADLEDALDRQPAYIAGYPTSGRSLTATLSYDLP